MTVNRLWLPQAIDDEYLTGTGEAPGEQPARKITITGCYIESIRLQDIIGQFLAPINHFTDIKKRHSPNASGSGNRALDWYEKGDLDLKTVLEIDKLLDTWRRNLPIHLQVETYKNGHAALLEQDPERLQLLERQANVLTAYLLRPALSVLCRAPHDEAGSGYDSRSSSMGREMVIKAANMCLATTEALVDLMASSPDPQAARLPAPWYNVFYIHSCAIVLLLGYLCAPLYITSMDRNSPADAYSRKVLAVIQQQVFGQPDGVASQNGNEPNNSNNNSNNTADWLSEFLPVEPIDLQTMIPLNDQMQPLDMLAPGVAARDAPYLSDMGWIGDANDMA
ncbi:hypothetical protein SCUCBS95973_004099 [Sporothrix curviconia]|uniref:Uncharacterized protein n=1 Tax=Sporothrix curviconia TaxID=1260050 RepID=A0ABP0BLD3_9PEZI